MRPFLTGHGGQWDDGAHIKGKSCKRANGLESPCLWVFIELYRIPWSTTDATITFKLRSPTKRFYSFMVTEFICVARSKTVHRCSYYFFRLALPKVLSSSSTALFGVSKERAFFRSFTFSWRNSFFRTDLILSPWYRWWTLLDMEGLALTVSQDVGKCVSTVWAKGANPSASVTLKSIDDVEPADTEKTVSRCSTGSRQAVFETMGSTATTKSFTSGESFCGKNDHKVRHQVQSYYSRTQIKAYKYAHIFPKECDTRCTPCSGA